MPDNAKHGYILTGNYGLPVPPESLKLGGSSFLETDSRAGSINNSGRISPIHLPASALDDCSQVRQALFNTNTKHMEFVMQRLVD